MEFKQAVKSGFNNYATFSGRASRSEYWYFNIFISIIFIVANIVMKESALILVPIILFLPSLSLTVRRFRDVEKSVWWVLLNYTSILILTLIPFLIMDSFNSLPLIVDIIDSLAFMLKQLASKPTLFLIALFMISILMIIIQIYVFTLYIKKGTDGENQYGSDPLSLDSAH